MTNTVDEKVFANKSCLTLTEEGRKSASFLFAGLIFGGLLANMFVARRFKSFSNLKGPFARDSATRGAASDGWKDIRYEKSSGEYERGAYETKQTEGPNTRASVQQGLPTCIVNNLTYLGLPLSSVISRADVQAAFRRKAMESHPDRFSTDDPRRITMRKEFETATKSYRELIRWIDESAKR